MTRRINAEGLEVRVKTPQRNQLQMHLKTLDECVREDHPARAVWAYVCSRDLAAWYAEIQAVRGGVGRDAVDPRILLALWLLATIEGFGSARRLADLCTRDFAYLWICGEVTVNRNLLNDFRTSRKAALDKLMTDTIGTLLHQNLVQLTRVAQDGMRVRASAGKSSFRRRSTLKERLAEAEQQVRDCRQDDDDQGEGNRQEAARRRAAEERLQRLQQAIAEGQKLQEQRDQQQRNEGQEARVSTTDPEARVMKMANGGYNPAFNVQFATETESRIIVGVAVTNQGSDSGLMEPMLEQLRQRHCRQPADLLVDGGFGSRDDATVVEQQGVKVYSPIKKADETLAKGKDPYARHAGDSDEYFALRQRMKTEEAKEIYRERCSTAEFANAGCRNRGLQQFLLRGLEKTGLVALWHALAHNLQMILHHGWLPQVCGA